LTDVGLGVGRLTFDAEAPSINSLISRKQDTETYAKHQPTPLLSKRAAKFTPVVVNQ